jgi:hypothetical protein
MNEQNAKARLAENEKIDLRINMMIGIVRVDYCFISLYSEVLPDASLN